MYIRMYIYKVGKEIDATQPESRISIAIDIGAILPTCIPKGQTECPVINTKIYLFLILCFF